MCRWFGPELYRRAAGLVWAVSAFYTVTFCLIEWSLRNPYTTGDIVIRIVSGVLVGFLVPKLGGVPAKQISTARQLVGFLISTAALGALILVVYDTALLYNLGHLAGMLPYAAIAVIVLVAARLALQGGPSAGPGIAFVTGTAGWFLGYFFVPALSIRYGMIFGAPLIAAAAGLAVAVAAVARAAREVTFSRAWVIQMVAATVAGLATASVAYLVTGGYPEVRLLFAAAAFGAGVITVCGVTDRIYWR